MWRAPTTTRATAYPAHPLVSIFSGSVLFISARRQIRYCQRYSNTENTPRMHVADSAAGHTKPSAILRAHTPLAKIDLSRVSLQNQATVISYD
jgi:hypothetical protein